MTDFASFQAGGVFYPMPTGTGQTLLRQADPAVFYMLEFFKSVLETHLGPRLAEAAAGMQYLTDGGIVGSTVPYNPEPFLMETHTRFPMLALSRVSGTPEYIGQRKQMVHTLELAFVLKPMQAQEAESLLPILKAVAAVIDNRSEQGFDPAYTPTTPMGSAGDLVWAASRAGLSKVELKGERYGGYQPTPGQFFPVVIMTINAWERSEAWLPELQPYAGADVTIDHASEGTTVDAVAESASLPPPVIASLNVVSGTKQGSTAVQITGTGFVVGRRYRALFGGADAYNVLAVSAVRLDCLTPQFAAYPTQAVDVVVLDQDQQPSNELLNAYTFTTP